MKSLYFALPPAVDGQVGSLRSFPSRKKIVPDSTRKVLVILAYETYLQHMSETLLPVVK